MRAFILSLPLLLAAALPAQADEAAAAAFSERTGGVSFIALERGDILFERYANGGGAEIAQELASGTKSFSGVIAAIAVKDGLLSLDEKASLTLKEWRDDPAKADITIRDILHLTSGLKPAPIGRPPTYAAAIASPSITAPGSTFEYGPLNFQIFGEVMRRKLASYEEGQYTDAIAYLDARLFKPLGISPAQWNRTRDGYPSLPSGADLTARDWARFGEFVRRGGEWEGRLLVDRAAFDEMFEGSRVNPGYGLGWWLNEAPPAETLAASRTMRTASDLYTHPRRGELPGDLFMAAGAGDQRLYIIPSLDMVVVRQTARLLKGRRGKGFSDVEFLLTLLD